MTTLSAAFLYIPGETNYLEFRGLKRQPKEAGIPRLQRESITPPAPDLLDSILLYQVDEAISTVMIMNDHWSFTPRSATRRG